VLESTAPGFEYVFPAIRGVQARREYYVSMCPLRLLPKIFLFDDEELVPELRAQRTLNRNRLPEMARYVSDNLGSYVFSAITASIDGEVRFDPYGPERDAQRIGHLHVPMDARFVINDGQHRRAAIELALREHPELADESIAVVFFLDIGLARCQQMFADLNRHAIRPSKSLGVLYDHRDDHAKLTKLMVLKSPLFRDVVELERTTLSIRSRKLFTLSAIYVATKALLNQIDADKPLEDRAEAAAQFWVEVSNHIHEWTLVRDRQMTAAEVRSEFIHSHGIVLQAIGRVGNELLQNGRRGWKKRLEVFGTVDWRRSNAALWEGRAMIGGRVSKASHNVTLTTNVLKERLGLPLAPEEQRAEDAFRRGDDAS
jgi:DNA sulfur modification protein DndB